MAKSDLTDEEKAKAILGEVEDASPDETTENAEDKPKEELKPEDVETPEVDESDEEKPHEDEVETGEPADSTFTKQFPNLKGETLEEYVPELETAYDNSFKESLRLVEENKQLKAQLAQTNQAPPAAPANIQDNSEIPTAPTTSLDPVTASILEDVKSERTRTMIAAFDDFKKDYPQALDQANFDAFTKASDGVNAALTATLGYKPSWDQLFKATANTLGWERATPDKKGALIKENASIGRTPSSQAPARPRPAKVSDEQVDTYLKMFTSKTREEAIKELSEVV